MAKTNRGKGGQPGNQNASKSHSHKARLKEIWKTIERQKLNDAMTIDTEVKFKLDGTEPEFEFDGKEPFFESDKGN